MKILDYFIKELINKYKKVYFCQHWRFTDMRQFQWYNFHQPQKGLFRIELGYTAILEAQDYNTPEEYLSSIRTVRRQEFNKAQRVLKIERGEDELLLDELHHKTFTRQGQARDPRHSFLVKSIAKSAIAYGYGCLKFAKINDKAVSAVLFLYDNRSAFYFIGANDPDYRNTGANTILLIEMINDAFSKGFKEIDFVGVNSPNRGDYKLSFNAELKPYFICFNLEGNI